MSSISGEAIGKMASTRRVFRRLVNRHSMCGYCIEAGAVLEFVEQCRLGEELLLANDCIWVYLQESEDLPDLLGELKVLEDYDAWKHLIVFRLWEDLLQGRQDRHERLVSEMDEVVSKLFVHAGPLQDLMMQGLTGGEQVFRMMLDANRQEWLQLAVETLEDYLRRFVEQERDTEKLKKAFPECYAAFQLLTGVAPDHPVVRRLAIEETRGDPPDFVALDLWLQRKACLHCVRELGVAFLFEHYSALRLELVLYLLMRDAIDSRYFPELRRLHEKHTCKGQIVLPDTVPRYLEYRTGGK